MLCAATATDLLQRADSVERLLPVGTALGFARRFDPLTPELHAQLALPAAVAHARLGVGEGALRALVVELRNGAAPRETFTELARAIGRHGSHCLWLVIGCTRAGGSVFIGAWQATTSRPQVRALIVDRHHVYASDAETLCALAAATRNAPDVLVHTRWLEILGRDTLTRRFHRRAAAVVQQLADDLGTAAGAAARSELALLNVSRLVFLAFLQSKGWLDGNHSFLQSSFDACVDAGGQVHKRMLEPLFFGTLNTRSSSRQRRAREFGRLPYLNGGLFARTAVEKLHRGARFSDAALATVFGDLLSRFRFSPREDSTDWSEAAVDPEILGRAFESLMEQSTRGSTGVFYTPVEIVERATDLALHEALAATAPREAVEALVHGEVHEEAHPDLRHAVERIRLLDPACGSGAFLVHALRVLADLRVALGERSRPAARAAVLRDSIYGVDINPTAVWLCQLRLWLCLAVECPAGDPGEVPPLPNLDRNIRVGDTLSGGMFGTIAKAVSWPDTARLRARYVRAQGQRKRTLAAALDRAERDEALAELRVRLHSVSERRREILGAIRSRDLFGEKRATAALKEELRRVRAEVRSLRLEELGLRRGGALPFSFAIHFPDAANAGGFDVIVGNPPWVRPHKLAPGTRDMLRANFAVVRAPVAACGRRPAFGGQVDLAAPFVERSLGLLAPGGASALLLPAKLWSSVAGGALRRHMMRTARICALEDFSTADAMFTAVTYPSLLVFARNGAPAATEASFRGAIHRRGGTVGWSMRARDLRLSDDDTSPWMLVPHRVRRAFDLLSEAGTPLGESHFGQPRLGVKTGCNAAFVVTVENRGRELAEIRQDERRGWVEATLLRPVLRGELVRAWRSNRSREQLIWTHDEAHRPLRRLPPHAARWLGRWRRELEQRADARAGAAWWRLFRTPAARSDRCRVVWSDIGRRPRALVLAQNDRTVPINTCYVVFADGDDALGLAALLNSPLAAGWLNVVGEPARGGYRRYMSWTVAALPVPRDQSALRAMLAPLARAALAGAEPGTADLLDATLAAYDVRHRDVAALLEWLDV